MNFKILFVVLVLGLATAERVSLVCESALFADADKPFNYALTANGGSGRYAFEVLGLPAGLRNQGAVIAGIPSAAGTYPVTIRTYDDQGNTDVKTVIINVNSGASANVYVNGNAVAGSTGTYSVSSSQTATVSVNTNGNGNVNVNGQTVGGATTINVNGGLAGVTSTIPSWLGSLNPTGSAPAGGAPGSPSAPGAPGASGPDSGAPGTAPTGGAPGSGAPGSTPAGGSPSGPSPSGSTPSGSTPISIGPVPAGYSPNYPTGAGNPFPTQTFPTGTSPNFIPSNLATQIENYNYQVVTSRDTYSTTTEDIRSQAVFQRQINANKAVANLLSIIQQLTANVNGVQADIPSATQAVNQAIADQRVAQQKVAAAENANKTLTSNIESVRTQITTLQTNLGKVNTDLGNAQDPIDSATTNKATIQANLDAINSRLGNLPNALAAAKQAQKDAQAALDALRSQINTLNGKISTIQVDIDNSATYSAAADADITSLDGQIAALLAQLDKLRQQRADAKNRSDYYKTINITGGAQIRQYKTQIDGINGQIPAAQAALDAANANVDKINRDMGDASTTIANLKGKLAESDIAITNAQKNKDGLASQSATIVQSITSYSSTLNNLLSQVPAYNNALVQAYNDGNDANDRYAQLKGVLDALKAKYLESLTQLNDAKSALEKARSEKEIADIAVNEQIKRQGGSTVLPYSIPGTGDLGIGRTTTTTTTTTSSSTTGGSRGGNIPNGNGPNGSGRPGAPGAPGSAGSGSVFGPRPGSNIGAGGALGQFAAGAGTRPGRLTGDLTHYISNSLTSGVNAATLYPFVVKWGGLRRGVDGNAAWPNGNFGCGKSQSLASAGTITEINPGSVTITGNDGQTTTLYLGGCTSLQANKPDYEFTVGDRVQWSGYDAQRQDIRAYNAESVTCYA